MAAGRGRRDEPGHPLDQWPVTEAALRLDGIRAQLDRVIGGWQQRIAAGGAITSLDPGGQWLIRLFTVGTPRPTGPGGSSSWRRQITEQAREQAGPVGRLPGRAGNAGIRSRPLGRAVGRGGPRPARPGRLRLPPARRNGETSTRPVR